MKKYFAIPLSMAVIASTLPMQTEAASLSDISGHRYEEAINALVNNGVISGYPDKTYRPEQALMRRDVVILLGRYLETQGYSVPSDYKTNMRFTDLRADFDNNLLKYAALVKDTGVFVGGNGKLLYNDFLSRHHAALVLVRAFSIINNTDYAEEDRELSYKDIEHLSKSDQNSISIFYNYFKEDYFEPSTPITRGEFAQFLYGIQQESKMTKAGIQSIQVLNDQNLFVTFTDGRAQNVKLARSLQPNVSTQVTFTVNGRKYTETVKMIVDEEFEVESVSNPNAGQFEIHFSKPVALADNYNALDIQKLVQLSPRDAQGTPTLTYGQLSKDKKTLTVTVSNSFKLYKRYYLTINGVHSEEGATLDYIREPVSFEEDKTKPEIKSVEQISSNEVLVRFTEPVYADYSRSYKLSNGKNVSNILSRESIDKTGIIFDLSNATVDGKSLEKNTDVIVDFTSLRDYNDNYTNNTKAKIRKSDNVLDKTPPTLVSVEQYGARKLKLEFSKPMRIYNLYNVRVQSETKTLAVDDVVQDTENPNAFILTMDDFLRGTATVTTRKGFYVFDLADNRLTFNEQLNFKYNANAPKIEYTEVVREDNSEYLYIYFDKAIDLSKNAYVSVTGEYTVNGQKMNISQPLDASVYLTNGNPKVARVQLSELLNGIDRENTTFTINMSFTGVANDYGVAINKPIELSFSRSKDYNYNANKLQIISVETSRTDPNIKNSNLIVVNFNHPVDVDTAMKLENYSIKDGTIEKVNVNKSNLKQVELYIKPGTITKPLSKDLSIEKLRAQGSVYVMEDYYEDVYLNENTAPALNMYSSSTQTSEYVTLFSPLTFTNGKQIVLTYNEALMDVPSDLFIVKNDSGQVLESETMIDPTDNRRVIIKMLNTLPRYKTVTIHFKNNRTLTDLYYNEASRKPFQFTVPYY